MSSQEGGVSVLVRDISGQKRQRVSGIPKDATAEEFVSGLVASLRLKTTGSQGEPLTYQARLDREGRHLQPSERLADAIRDDDEIALIRNVDAG